VPFHHRTVRERLVALDVGHPEPIRRWWGEVALDQVRGWDSGRVAAGQATAPTAVDTYQAMLAHQPGDPFASNPDIQSQAQLGVHARGAVGPTAAGMNVTDLLGERLVSQRPSGWRPGCPGVVAGACHTQHAGKPGDRVVCFLRVD
jgi:hypothetical protein